MDRSLAHTFSRIKNEELLLPDFQRDYKWHIGKQKSLLASILLRFPVGSSLILKGNSQDFALRRIGEREQYALTEDKSCEYLLDGQQRTTTLYNALNDTYDISQFENKNELEEFIAAKASPLKVRWFLRLPVGANTNQDVTDVFGAKGLSFCMSSLDSYEPEEVIDVFQEFTFNEKSNKGVTKWLSPFYQLDLKNKDGEPKQITDFVNKCFANGFVPLYLLGRANGKNILRRILREIAKANAQNLQDQYGRDINYVKEHYDHSDMLVGYDSIETVIESGEDYDELVTEMFRTQSEDWVSSVMNYLANDLYERYELSYIQTEDIRRAIPIFCHLNDGGMPLDDFDLVAAKAAKRVQPDDAPYSMSKEVRTLFGQPLELSAPLQMSANSTTGLLYLDNLDCLSDGLPSGYISKAILAVCTMLACTDGDASYEIKKVDTSSKTLLQQSTETIRRYITVATTAVLRAYAFLLIRCGVYSTAKLHYKLMLQPIAYALADDAVWNSQPQLNKIEFWYWSSLFSGRYLYDQSAVVIDDINSLKAWVSGRDGQSIVARMDRLFISDEYNSKELLTYRIEDKPKEGIRSGLLQFVLSQKPYDMLADDTIALTAYSKNDDGSLSIISAKSDDYFHDHHLVPVDLFKGLGQTSDSIRSDANHPINSPLNRTLISANANRAISDRGPTEYFDDLAKGKYDHIALNSHCVTDAFKSIHGAEKGHDVIRAALDARFEAIKTKLDARLLALRA